MANYREIVTKAIVGKGKKKFSSKNIVTPEIVPTTILGCWVINHNFKGYRENDKIVIEGNYDVNIWYSCLNDTKTEVVRHSDNYREVVLSPRKNGNVSLLDNEEIIIRSLNQPSCVKTEIQNGQIIYTIEKELGIEIVGDTKVKIAIDEDESPWDEIDESADDEISKQIDNEVKEEFLD